MRQGDGSWEKGWEKIDVIWSEMGDTGVGDGRRYPLSTHSWRGTDLETVIPGIGSFYFNLREHPFNLKGGRGYGFFWEKFFLSLKWAEKNILLALCA